jgi:hypothetical protein
MPLAPTFQVKRNHPSFKVTDNWRILGKNAKKNIKKCTGTSLSESKTG